MVNSVGIDVAKNSCQIALRLKNGNYLQSSFANNRQGINKFIKFLRTSEVSKDTPLVLESTGGYHLLYAMTLSGTHFRGVKVINGMVTKKYQKASIRRTKTDKVDAKILADIGIIEDFHSFHQSKANLVQRKRICLLRKLEHIRQKLSRSIKDFEEIMKAMKINEFVDRSSLKAVEKQIKELKAEIIHDERGEFLETLDAIPGISPISAAILLVFLKEKKFQTKDQLIAFTGLDLTICESGSSINRRRRLSKRGNSYLRRTLFLIGWALKTQNSYYKDYYDLKRSEGHHYYTCILAVARKFLKHFYALHKQFSQN